MGSGSGMDNPVQMWPWQELGVLADELYAQLTERTREIMQASGEDPDGPLFRIRVGQVAFGVNARAEKEAQHEQ